MSEADVQAVEDWLAAYKTFENYFPGWVPTPGHRCDWEVRWPIVDANGTISGMACFEADSAFEEVSISIIYRGNPVYRLDRVPNTRQEGNSYPAHLYVPDLPVTFKGSHIHAWEDHREYVRKNGRGPLIFRRPIEQPHDIETAFGIVSKAVGLTVPSSHRGITLPPQSGLNLDWKGRRR
jgi:hypothetical protein